MLKSTVGISLHSPGKGEERNLSQWSSWRYPQKTLVAWTLSILLPIMPDYQVMHSWEINIPGQSSWKRMDSSRNQNWLVSRSKTQLS